MLRSLMSSTCAVSAPQDAAVFRRTATEDISTVYRSTSTCIRAIVFFMNSQALQHCRLSPWGDYDTWVWKCTLSICILYYIHSQLLTSFIVYTKPGSTKQCFSNQFIGNCTDEVLQRIIEKDTVVWLVGDIHIYLASFDGRTCGYRFTDHRWTCSLLMKTGVPQEMADERMIQ